MQGVSTRPRGVGAEGRGQGAGRLSLGGQPGPQQPLPQDARTDIADLHAPLWPGSGDKCGGAVGRHGHLCPGRKGRKAGVWDRVQLRPEASFNPGGQCREGPLEPSRWFWT